MNNKIDRIKELIPILNEASYAYYTLDKPIMADIDYDKLYDELQQLEKQTGYIDQNSPTKRVGDVVLEGFKKIQHRSHLWSLDKAQTKETIQDFIYKCNRFVKDYNAIHHEKLPETQFIVSKKYDGLTINSSYSLGKLYQSATRGTGETGEDITVQSKTIIGLPHEIKDTEHNIDVHGEALMTKNAFRDYNNHLKDGEEPLKNLRNGAAGALRNLNVKETARRKLIVQIYDISYSDKQFISYVEMLQYLKDQNFPVIDYTICNNFDEVNNAIDNIESVRDDLQYDIDGAVVRLNDIKTSELMGYTEKFPKYAIAYKYKAEEVTTTLLDVEWNTGRTGKVTPRAKVKPVELNGAIVQYATLNNIDDIRRKDLRIGAKVFIRRSNDVIPEIMGIAEDNINSKTINAPVKCPACGSSLIRNGAHYFCENTLGCKPQLIKNIVHFTERKAMNIEGLSDKTIEQLMDANIINNVIDIYKLKDKKNEVLNIDRFGEKKFQNLIDNIEKSRTCKLSSFIYALGIEGVGEKTAKDITKVFNSIDKLCDCTVPDLLKVDDIGEITAYNIYDWFMNDINIKMLNELLKYIKFEEDKKVVNNKVDLSGKIFVATGKLEHFSRDSIKEKIESLGAKCNGSVSAKTTYLLTNDTDTGTKKNQDAKKFGVQIINENDFLKLIGE